MYGIFAVPLICSQNRSDLLAQRLLDVISHMRRKSIKEFVADVRYISSLQGATFPSAIAAGVRQKIEAAVNEQCIVLNDYRKRPNLPSGMISGARSSTRPWVILRKRGLNGLSAGGDQPAHGGSIHIEIPGRAVISVECGKNTQQRLLHKQLDLTPSRRSPFDTAKRRMIGC